MGESYPELPGVVSFDQVKTAMEALGLPIERCISVEIGVKWVEATYQAVGEDGKLLLRDDSLVLNTFTIPIAPTTPKEKTDV